MRNGAMQTTTEACQLAADWVIATSDARGEVATLQAERDAYRALAQQALHHIHALDIELARVRERYHRTLEESRTLRTEMRRYLSVQVGRAAA